MLRSFLRMTSAQMLAWDQISQWRAKLSAIPVSWMEILRSLGPWALCQVSLPIKMEDFSDDILLAQ